MSPGNSAAPGGESEGLRVTAEGDTTTVRQTTDAAHSPARRRPTAVVDVDVRHDSLESDRRAIGLLDVIPDGSNVRLDVGCRSIVGATLVYELHRHADRVVMNVYGIAAGGWARAIETGLWEWVA